MSLRVSAMPSDDVRFVLPSGAPVTTIDALWVSVQLPHALIPEFIRFLRVASSSLSQSDRSRATAEPTYMARKFFISDSLGAGRSRGPSATTKQERWNRR